MRTVTFAVLAGLSLSTVAPAWAADLDYGVLRGPEYEPAAPVVDWSGLYFGAHAGYTSASNGFRNVYQEMISDALHDTTAESIFNASTLLRTQSVRAGGTSFGGFAGVNYQFDETVLGLEVDYTSFGKVGISSDSRSIFRLLDSGDYQAVSFRGKSSTQIDDFGTIRARAGYALGNFLPYVTGGLAIGRALITDRVDYQYYGYSQTTYTSNLTALAGQKANVSNFGYARFSQTNPTIGTGETVAADRVPLIRAKTKVVAGIALGAGLEFALTQNIVLRGEYQYVLFNDFDGHKANINTVRGGAAVKF
jgi:outer membrane immunogenic protein